jgi:hypothetical protein
MIARIERHFGESRTKAAGEGQKGMRKAGTA